MFSFLTMPGMYYDLPWIDGMVHMQGGQQFPLYQTGKSGSSTWYNNTRGIRYTLVTDGTTMTLTLPSGAYMTFTFISGQWDVNRAYLDTTGNNYVTYSYTSGALSFVTDSSGRQIYINPGSATITYGNSQTIQRNDLGPPSSWGISNTCSDTSSQSRGLQVVDAIGRTTNYYVCGYKLIRLDSPNGGRVDYAYATSSSPDNRVWQGTDVYSLPLLRMDIYNESGAGTKARSLVFNWNFQNGEVVRALVNTTDKSGVVQGSNEYIFNSAAGTASVRVYDSAGQVLYYDMDTLTGSQMKDLSGNANSGTIFEATSVVGKYGNARYYDGTDDYIQVADSKSLDITGAITLSAWINNVNTGTSLNGGIVWKSNPLFGNGNQKTYELGFLSGVLYFQIGDGTTASTVGYTWAQGSGGWHDIVGVWTGLKQANAMQLYVDGSLVSQSTPNNLNIRVTTDPLNIGGNPGGATYVFFQGSIDEVRVQSRALSSEDVGVLYTTNALKRGQQQNWYSINDMPHLAEGFVGDQTTASVVTQDAIDDWGNQIYHKDALGNETFTSYANTNHQNHFYAPGSLTKNTNTQFNTEFIDFSNGQFPTGQGTWTVGSQGTAVLDYTQFDKITPSLRMDTPTTSTSSFIITHKLVVTTPRFFEFRMRTTNSASQYVSVTMSDSSGNFLLGEESNANGVFYIFNNNAWISCHYTSSTGAVVGLSPYVWYRLTFEVDWDTSPHTWKAYLNGIDLYCAASQTLATGVTSFYELKLDQTYIPSPAWSAWIDDIKIYNNANGVQTGYNALNIGFSGLQPRQSIRLLAENGTVIDQTMQTSAGTLWLSFNSALTGAYMYAENGDNAKTVVQVYAEDGTLEYQSPLTRFFVGEQYTYTRPRAFADRLVKTTSGAVYWPQTIYADDSCPSGATCDGSPTWVWQQAPNVPPLSGVSAHVTTFNYGVRWHRWLQTTGILTPDYFVTYIRISSGNAPASIGLIVNGGTGWKQVYWGSAVNDGFSTPTYSMGPVPSARDQWIQLVVNNTDLGLGSYWYGFGYELVGGAAAWDVTTTQTIASWSYAAMTVTGLPSGVTAGVYYASNGTLIGKAAAVSGVATIPLFSRVNKLTTFPVNANIKIYDANNEYYFGPARNIWPGDTFRYIGASSFFDSKTSGIAYWPSSTIHTALLGNKKFSGDCLDSILCYDMETMAETTTAIGTGTVTVSMKDLSGKGNDGVATNAALSTITTSAVGLASNFDGASSKFLTANTLLSGVTASVTISAWVYLSNTSNRGAFVKVGSGPALDGYGLGVGSTSWDANGNNLIGLYEGVRFINTGTAIGIGLHHVVMVIDSSAIPSFYLDGTSLGAFSGSPPVAPSTPTAIGGYNPDGSHPRFFAGTIDQVLIYNKALTSSQILGLYYSRMPGGLQVYLRSQANGFPVTSRVPYEGTYLYVAATYDSKGNVLSVTDAGRTTSGGTNVTTYAYSTLDSRDYRTQVNRSDGKQVYYAYDFQSGVKYGTLDIDCRRSRTQYDAMSRPLQTSIYDTDSSEVLHLDMETATYNSLKDVSCAGTSSSNNGQTVTLTGTSGIAGVDGSGRYLPTINDRIAISSFVAPAITTLTLSVWGKLDSLSNNGKVHTLFSDASQSATTGFIFFYNDLTPTTVVFQYATGSTWLTVSWANAISDTNWHLYTVTADYSLHTVALYIDGKLISSQSMTGAIAPPLNGRTLYIGSYDAGTYGHPFVGSLDEARLFTRSLGASEISDLWTFKYKLLTRSSVAYDDTFPTSITSYDGVSTPRVLFYDMSTTKGGLNALEDLSGNGNSGIEHGVGNVTGKFGNAKSFTTNEYISASDSPSLNLGYAFTIAAWVYPTSMSSGPSYEVVRKIAFTPTRGYLFRVIGDGTNTGHLDVEVWNNGQSSSWVSSNGGIGVNSWQHIGFTFVSGVGRFYRQGTAITTTQLSGSALSPGSTGSPLDIGSAEGVGEYFLGNIDEVHIIPRDLSATEISNLYNGIEKSHTLKSYQDGLGRTTRNVVMDMFGAKITTVATLGWNDKPINSYLPSGGYFTYIYDFLGRTLTTQTPGDSATSGISRTIVSEKARMVESVDAVGRKAYVKMDLLGRTVETAVWNPQTNAYGNWTNASYNALSEVTLSKDAKGQTTTIYYNSLGKAKMTVFPDGTNSIIYYDDNLRAFEKVDVMGHVSISAYDSIGRVTSMTLKPTLSSSTTYVVAFGYDPVHDDILTIDNTTAKITRTYDSLHRMLTEKLDVPSSSPLFTGTITYAYDSAGKVTSITYPVSGNPQAVYTYDSLGRPIEVDYGGSKYAVLAYDSFGRLSNIHYWQGTTDTALQQAYTYDARDRVTQLNVYTSTATYMRLYYGYDKASSEIANSTDDMYTGTGGASNAKSVTYSYDGNGRLAQAVGPYGASEATEYDCYDYDQVGNIAHWRQGTASCPTSGTGYNTYNYGASPAWNRLDSLSYNSMSFTYNSAGSMLTKVESGATTTYTQDFLQQLVKVVVGGTTYTYSYDGLGRRIKTYDGTTTSYFMYAGSTMLYSKVGTTETAFVYVGGMLLFRKEGTASTPEARYYHSDISPGNVRLITYYKASKPNLGINVDAKYRYRPFGDMITLSGSTQRFHYAQQEFDSALRLYHMGARYYDPIVGRFIQRDPIGSGYSYATNNPLSYADPSGKWPFLSPPGVNLGHNGMAKLEVAVVFAAIAIATAIPTGGGSLAVYGIIGGLIVGTIAIAVDYLLTGGSATAEDYLSAFVWGFMIGAAIGSVYASFAVEGAAVSASEKAGLSDAAAGAASRAEAPLVRGTFHGVDTEGYVIEGRFVPRIEGGSGDLQGIRAKIGVEDVFENPNVLRAAPGRLNTPSDLPDLIADAQSRGWRVTTLGEGSQEGTGLRLLGPDDGRLIMYHPEGGHWGEYWKVSSGTTGITKVMPEFTWYPGGWVEVFP